MSPFPSHPQKIAVIGSGAAGLGAAWLLSKQHHVDLLEAGGYLGGHANTVDVSIGDRSIPVDTGFIVYNETNYPALTSMFDHFGVETEASEMSFGVSIDGGALEYAGSWPEIFAQRRNILRPRYWRMLADIRRFYREASSLSSCGMTLGELIDARGYSTAFRDDHLLPMAAAIWSGTLNSMLAFPAESFISFFENHGLLRFKGRPQWRTVSGGSRSYVARISKEISGSVRLRCPVESIRREDEGILVRPYDGGTTRYDQVVIATHADTALSLLHDADVVERRILDAFCYQPNRAVLHRDADLMPKRRAVWSSWNYIGETSADENSATTVTYWMNRLQNIDQRHPLFVSLNPSVEPRDETIIAEFQYDHPQFDRAALNAQDLLNRLQGRRRTWFCGSYFGHGFHEDAFSSGLEVARNFGIRPPWVEPAPEIPAIREAA